MFLIIYSSTTSDTDEEVVICDLRGFPATGKYKVLIDAKSRRVNGTITNNQLEFQFTTDELIQTAIGFTFEISEYPLSNLPCRFSSPSVPQVLGGVGSSASPIAALSSVIQTSSSSLGTSGSTHSFKKDIVHRQIKNSEQGGTLGPVLTLFAVVNSCAVVVIIATGLITLYKTSALP